MNTPAERLPESDEPRSTGPPPRDELDLMLRQWHAANAERAAAGRDRLLARIREQEPREAASAPAGAGAPRRPVPRGAGGWAAPVLTLMRRALVNRYSPVAAALVIVVALVAVLTPSPRGSVRAAQGIIQVPDGGRLDALDHQGTLIGPCPLRHTDVSAEISGFLSRVTLRQTYHNVYKTKIEAVYTFPMSHRGAVDRMTMTIGDRVVVGEIKERQLARQIYEQARQQNYVASLLEQERPNIFTQSVANIEPGAEVIVEIGYVEVLQSADGVYSFEFPMVVGPRYIPGSPTASPSLVPAELAPREGVVLLGPATLTPTDAGDTKTHGTLQPGKLATLLHAARPIQYPGGIWWGRGDATGGAGQPTLWYRFEAAYCDGSREFGELYTDGTGQLNGRWLYTDPRVIEGMGSGFAQDTNQVPDASRVTPLPVRPGTRSGHDVSLRVTIDTGGPGIADLKSDLHEIARLEAEPGEAGLPRRLSLALASRDEIPNRDFILSWRQTAPTIEQAVFTHRSERHGDGFLTLVLQPPDRLAPGDVPPRELIFVVDSSGSMKNLPIEKSKEIMTRAIDAMRPADTFNVITFAGHTAVLWDEPAPATAAARAEATAFVQSLSGRGGTEMMSAIEKALVQKAPEGAGALTPADLANLPADGRRVEVAVPDAAILRTLAANPAFRSFSIRVRDDLMIALRTAPGLADIPAVPGAVVRLSGRWETIDGQRVLVAERAWIADGPGGAKGPMRLCVFLTDGYVGNDMAIIDAVRRNAATTRVFAFGIGNSVNRFLIEGMARAGRGESEVVTLQGESADADAAVARFVKRIETPVLTDIELSFGGEVTVSDLVPAAGAIPDLFDAKPLVIHGRYAASGRGTVTLRGRTGAGPWERTIELDLPADQPDHDVIATLWARSRIDSILAPRLADFQHGTLAPDLQKQVVDLGERFGIMSQYTSFVAVEKSRMAIEGKPVLVAVPIEMPSGVSWEGTFGQTAGDETWMTFQATEMPPQLGMNSLSLIGTPPTRGRAVAMDAAGAAPRPGAPAAPVASEPDRARREITATAGVPVVPLELESKVAEKATAERTAAADRAAPSPARAYRPPGPPTPRLPPAAPPESKSLLLAEEPGVMQEPADLLDADSGGLVAMTPVNGVSGDIRLAGELFKSAHRADEAGSAGRDVLSVGGDGGQFSGGGFGGGGPGAFAWQLGAPGGQPVFAEQIVLHVATLVENDKLDEARPVAATLAGRRPDFELGVRLNAVVSDEILDPQKRREIIAQIAAEARPALEEAKRDLERRARLQRVLHAELLALIAPPVDRDAALKDAMLAAGKGPRVTVLVQTADEPTIALLRETGLAVEASSRTLPIVVGTAPVERLAALALLDPVRRIEPTVMTPEHP
jgi:hypothetical protein